MTFDTDYIKFAESDYKMADRFNDANHQFRYYISKVFDNLIYHWVKCLKVFSKCLKLFNAPVECV